MRLLVVLALGACVEWTAPQMLQQRTPSSVIERREQGCYRVERVHERHSVVENKKLTSLAKVSMLAGAVMILVGVKFFTEGEHGTQSGGRQPARIEGGFVFTGWGVLFLGAPLINRYAIGPSERGSVVIDKEVSVNATAVPCPSF